MDEVRVGKILFGLEYLFMPLFVVPFAFWSVMSAIGGPAGNGACSDSDGAVLGEADRLQHEFDALRRRVESDQQYVFSIACFGCVAAGALRVCVSVCVCRVGQPALAILRPPRSIHDVMCRRRRCIQIQTRLGELDELVSPQSSGGGNAIMDVDAKCRWCNSKDENGAGLRHDPLRSSSDNQCLRNSITGYWDCCKEPRLASLESDLLGGSEIKERWANMITGRAYEDGYDPEDCSILPRQGQAEMLDVLRRGIDLELIAAVGWGKSLFIRAASLLPQFVVIVLVPSRSIALNAVAGFDKSHGKEYAIACLGTSNHVQEAGGAADPGWQSEKRQRLMISTLTPDVSNCPPAAALARAMEMPLPRGVTRVYYVTPEFLVQNSVFQRTLLSVARFGFVGAVVSDEADAHLSASLDRPDMVAARKVCKKIDAAAQQGGHRPPVYSTMTATARPHERILISNLCLSGRPKETLVFPLCPRNLAWSQVVLPSASGKSSDLVAATLEWIADYNLEREPIQKVLVLRQTVSEVTSTAAEFERQSSAYSVYRYAGEGRLPGYDRAGQLESFASDSGAAVLVGNAAVDRGVDIVGIDLVVYMTWVVAGMATLMQAAGRAGRARRGAALCLFSWGMGAKLAAIPAFQFGNGSAAINRFRDYAAFLLGTTCAHRFFVRLFGGPDSETLKCDQRCPRCGFLVAPHLEGTVSRQLRTPIDCSGMVRDLIGRLRKNGGSPPLSIKAFLTMEWQGKPGQAQKAWMLLHLFVKRFLTFESRSFAAHDEGVGEVHHTYVIVGDGDNVEGLVDGEVGCWLSLPFKPTIAFR